LWYYICPIQRYLFHNLVKLSEYDILTYTGSVSTSYLKFLSGLGTIFSVSENQNIYCGGIDRSGCNGKYAVYYQDSVFQVIFHISNLLKPERKNESENDYLNYTLTIRKKLLGNDYINIIWMDNPNNDFDANLIISGVILIYIVILPISETHYLIKLKQNKRSKFNIRERLAMYFMEDYVIKRDEIFTFLKKLIIQLNLMIAYILQKSAIKKLEAENLGKNFQTLQFDTNISQRFKELERINYRFKNSI
jgi:hypothetical protein